MFHKKKKFYLMSIEGIYILLNFSCLLNEVRHQIKKCNNRSTVLSFIGSVQKSGFTLKARALNNAMIRESLITINKLLLYYLVHEILRVKADFCEEHSMIYIYIISICILLPAFYLPLNEIF